MESLIEVLCSMGRIEIGLNTWSDSSVELETPMLTKYPLKTKFQQKRDYLKVEEQVWWCADYNSLFFQHLFPSKECQGEYKIC